MKGRYLRNLKMSLGLLGFLSIIFVLIFSLSQRKIASHAGPKPLILATINGIYQQNSTTNDIPSSYDSWKTTYITSASDNTLRVIRPENYNDTVSEGIATGMLLSASMKDKTTFDGLWMYAKKHFNSHGLMSWHINAQDTILDNTSATDADEDMAYALIVADLQWGGYKNDATTLLQNISLYEVEPGSYVLKPGDTWGGSDVTSPAYFAPAYYKAFAEYTHDQTWNSVQQTSTDSLNKLMSNTPAKDTGLMPDWMTIDGEPVTIYPDKPYMFGYRSIKAVWRLGMNALWNNDEQSTTILKTISQSFQKGGVNNIVDGYLTDGTPIRTSHNATFVDAVTIAASVDNNQDFKKQLISEYANTSGQHTYYADSYHLLTLLLLNNKLPHIE